MQQRRRLYLYVFNSAFKWDNRKRIIKQLLGDLRSTLACRQLLLIHLESLIKFTAGDRLEGLGFYKFSAVSHKLGASFRALACRQLSLLHLESLIKFTASVQTLTLAASATTTQTMTKKIKITLGILGLLVVGVVGFIILGLYGMEIEDTYGDNQDIYYRSRQGDIVVNHQTKEFGKIKKTWKRFYVVNGPDTLDVGNWWDDKNIEIYKLTNSETSESTFTYDDIDRLKDEGILKLKRKLR